MSQQSIHILKEAVQPLSIEDMPGLYVRYSSHADPIIAGGVYLPIRFSPEGFIISLSGYGPEFVSYRRLAGTEELQVSRDLVHWVPGTKCGMNQL